jgi:hypothetical protein
MTKRSGVWFRVLSRLDRALVNATIMVADRVRSSKLTEALLKVREKVERVLEHGFVQTVFKVGLPLAHKIGLIAKSWGNPYAESWMSDLSFARFLAVMHINSGYRSICEPYTG